MKLEKFFKNISLVTMKVTNGCNLKCSYCNVEAMTPNTPRMSLDTAKQIADLLILNSKSEFVRLEFHGGEPLLMGDEWIENVLTYAKDLAKKHGKQIEFPLVTNATIIQEKRLRKLTDLGIQFSISADGPPEINDINRQGGKKVEQSLALFRQLDIPVGVMTVVGPNNYNRMDEVMNWLLDCGKTDFTTNFCSAYVKSSQSRFLS